MSDAAAVVDNEAEHRLELVVDGVPAELVYHRSGTRFEIVHREPAVALDVDAHLIALSYYTTHGLPVLVNTSFNVRGEPIVCTPEDAFRCFMGSERGSNAIPTKRTGSPSTGALRRLEGSS